MTGYARQQDLGGNLFVLRDFMDRFNIEGMIPVSLMELEFDRNAGNKRRMPPARQTPKHSAAK